MTGGRPLRNRSFQELVSKCSNVPQRVFSEETSSPLFTVVHRCSPLLCLDLGIGVVVSINQQLPIVQDEAPFHPDMQKAEVVQGKQTHTERGEHERKHERKLLRTQNCGTRTWT
jgi:hypothetical protein